MADVAQLFDPLDQRSRYNQAAQDLLTVLGEISAMGALLREAARYLLERRSRFATQPFGEAVQSATRVEAGLRAAAWRFPYPQNDTERHHAEYVRSATAYVAAAAVPAWNAAVAAWDAYVAAPHEVDLDALAAELAARGWALTEVRDTLDAYPRPIRQKMT